MSESSFSRHPTRRRRHVIRNLCDWVRNIDCWTGLRRSPDAYADALDRYRRDRAPGHRDSVWGKGDPPERFFAVGTTICTDVRLSAGRAKTVRLAGLVKSDQLSEVQRLIRTAHKVLNAAEKCVNGILFCGS